jgi:predicted aldo/keto reductase-like oxidoreductase
MSIQIPDIFRCMNQMKQFNDWNQIRYYRQILTQDGHGKASECLQCGLCESICPQGLEIRDLLTQAAEMFEKKED